MAFQVKDENLVSAAVSYINLLTLFVNKEPYGCVKRVFIEFFNGKYESQDRNIIRGKGGDRDTAYRKQDTG